MKIRRFKTQMKAAEFQFAAIKQGRHTIMRKDGNMYEVRVLARGQK